MADSYSTALGVIKETGATTVQSLIAARLERVKAKMIDADGDELLRLQGAARDLRDMLSDLKSRKQSD